MAKNRKARAATEEKGPARTFTISGGPSMGYTIYFSKEPLLPVFSRMWDAIECRDALNAGRPMSDFGLATATTAASA